MRPSCLRSRTTAWRGIFWVSLPPGILFVIGSFMVAESPRWLLRRGKEGRRLRRAAALAHDRSRRTRTQGDAGSRQLPRRARVGGRKTDESLLRRKYVIPFVLACIILACNQATGINSIIAYNTNILLQSGLSDVAAHWGYVVFTIINFAVTFGGVMLVDRKGRKFLLGVGTAGIIVSLICTGVLFLGTEQLRVDSQERRPVDGRSRPEAHSALQRRAGRQAAEAKQRQRGTSQPTSLVVIYSYGDFRAASQVVRSDDPAAKPIEITRDGCVPANKVVAFFSNPFGDLDAARDGSAEN